MFVVATTRADSLEFASPMICKKACIFPHPVRVWQSNQQAFYWVLWCSCAGLNLHFPILYATYSNQVGEIHVYNCCISLPLDLDQCLHNYKEWESTNSTHWKFCKYSTELLCNIPRLVSSSNKPQGGRTSRVWHWSLGARVQTSSLLMQILNKLWRWATLPCFSIRASAVVQVAVALWRSRFTMTLWHWVLSEPRIGWLVTRTTPTLSKDHRYILTTAQRKSHSAVTAMGH